jgi:hypothetical protein
VDATAANTHRALERVVPFVAASASFPARLELVQLSARLLEHCGGALAPSARLLLDALLARLLDEAAAVAAAARAHLARLLGGSETPSASWSRILRESTRTLLQALPRQLLARTGDADKLAHLQRLLGYADVQSAGAFAAVFTSVARPPPAGSPA